MKHDLKKAVSIKLYCFPGMTESWQNFPYASQVAEVSYMWQVGQNLRATLTLEKNMKVLKGHSNLHNE